MASKVTTYNAYLSLHNRAPSKQARKDHNQALLIPEEKHKIESLMLTMNLQTKTQREEWKKSMEIEFDALTRMKTWTAQGQETY